ncbi:MAG: cobyrinate a,c-diamide synthase [Xenococcaceae cyanobacterium]
MALLIAGERSGVGKTTVTLSLLSYLSQQNYQVQSFKVGPDYIDPMFHAAVTHRPCRNLDPILTSQTYVKNCFARHSHGVHGVLVEGVMGLFDGIARPIQYRQKEQNINDRDPQLNDYGSTAHIARLLQIPVLLVLDCSRLSSSIAAIVQGYRTLDRRINLIGVVLNRVGSDRHLELLKDALDWIKMPVFGVLRRNNAILLPDRHLGLVPTDELPGIKHIFANLAELGQNCFDWEKIFPLIEVKQIHLQKKNLVTINPAPSPVRIAIARDRAFNFYYQDNLDILSELGAELIFWSPLQAKTLPKNIQGLYFGGGFPEVFAQQLADNQSLLDSIRQAIQAGMPTYAECGGLMYLCQKLRDFSGQTWSMVGVIPTTVIMSKSLTLGYRFAVAQQNSPLLRSKQTVWGHEFHHSQLTTKPIHPLWQFQACEQYPAVKRQGLRSLRQSTDNLTPEGWRIKRLHASYLHLHFGEDRELPQKFLDCCLI